MNTHSNPASTGGIDSLHWVDFQYDGVNHRCSAVIGQRFRVTGILAAGGFGLLYRAEDQLLFRKKVLIKTTLSGLSFQPSEGQKSAKGN
jgi:hypothetical protein